MVKLSLSRFLSSLVVDTATFDALSKDAAGVAAIIHNKWIADGKPVGLFKITVEFQPETSAYQPSTTTTKYD